jgi:hypothetical protein
MFQGSQVSRLVSLKKQLPSFIFKSLDTIEIVKDKNFSFEPLSEFNLFL